MWDWYRRYPWLVYWNSICFRLTGSRNTTFDPAAYPTHYVFELEEVLVRCNFDSDTRWELVHNHQRFFSHNFKHKELFCDNLSSKISLITLDCKKIPKLSFHYSGNYSPAEYDYESNCFQSRQDFPKFMTKL